MEYEIFVWNAVLVINLHWVLLFHFINLHWVLLFHFSLLWSIELCALRLTTVIMQAPHALICVNVMIIWLIEKAFEHWISIERLTCSQLEPSIWGREGKELFPVTLNNSCPLDWNWLILVSEIKNTNMSSGEMNSSQQFSQCLIWLWRPCWSWTMNSKIWRMKEILKEILHIKWIEYTHLI